MFKLTRITENGTTVDIHVDEVEPTRFTALRDYLRREASAYPARIHGQLFTDGKPLGEPSWCDYPIEFDEPISVFAIVPGGVLPAMFLQSMSLMLDRNVVASLRRSSSSEAHSRAANRQFSFLDTRAHTVNPILGAFEGPSRATPDLATFRADVDRTIQAVRMRLPSASLLTHSDEELRRLHTWRGDFDKRAELETQFLMKAKELLADPVGRQHLRLVEDQLFDAASCCRLGPSLVVIATLARLYASTDGQADAGVAQGLLKLNGHYTKEMAYNALADLRQIELMVSSQNMPGSFALLTADKSLALLWCALRAQRKTPIDNDSLRFSLDPVPELFPRLLDERRAELLARLTDVTPPSTSP